MTATPEIPAPSVVGRTLRATVGGIGAIFGLGGLAGYYGAAREQGALSGIDFLLMGAFVLIAAGFGWLAWTGMRGVLRGDEPIAPSDRKSRLLIWISAGLGFVMALVLLVSGSLGGVPLSENPIFSNAPLSPLAMAIMLVGVVATLVISAMWHRTIDEHEAAAYNFGGIVSLYAYFTATVTWWLLWRGGYAPEPQAMSIFLGVTLVWLAGWVWQRQR